MIIKVSVILPVYNSGKYLMTAIDSILSQSLRDIEIILVDDGSTDGSSKLCDEYSDKDSRIKVIHQKNGGICSARNRAINIAHGEYIAFCDHDDEYLPGFLEHCYSVAKTKNADLVKARKRFIIKSNHRILKTYSNHLEDNTYYGDEVIDSFYELYKESPLGCVWDGLYKLSIIKKYNILFDEYFTNGGEDFDFNIRFFDYVKTFSTVNIVFYNHFFREGFSTSSKFHEHMLDQNTKIGNKLSKFMNNSYNRNSRRKIVYNYIITNTFFMNQVRILTHKACPFSFAQKKEYIKNYKNKDFINEDFWNISSKEIFNISTRIGLCYFMLKHSLFTPLLLIYTLHNK
ncbi:glycosyltransferase family 2 protein [Segatella baroniae]|uniref:glycosyltransferase family 2 protein n=1 Tax=Segatella baroniae TaxID=305719 RepID=UPI0004107871|nr:glycosyltransferase family 2 protein [Segatella baroniae]